jgi:hypothetical protein
MADSLHRMLSVLLGIVLLVGGLVMLADNLQIVQTGVRTTGVIVANDFDCSGRSCGYYPEVRFVLRGGQTSVVRGTDRADPPEFREGEAVTV